MALSEEFGFRKYELRSIWQFYKAYNLSLVILGLDDTKEKKKNYLWRKLIDAQIIGKQDNEAYVKLQSFMKKDFAVITKAIKELATQNEELGYNSGEHWTKNVLGVLYGEIMD